MRRHLAMFRQGPSVSEPRRWREFVWRSRSNPPPNMYRAIEREFGVVTPPGFSDCINDPQPPWSDVTFLRLFLDHPTASMKHLPDPASQPPYVFTDTIKSSRFPGCRPNRELWKMLSDILPFYQRFGVDGARVDMGHALPPELQGMIVNKARRIDPDFCLLAEEFDHAAAAAARRDGYNAIIGRCWYTEQACSPVELRNFVNNVLPSSRLPALAAVEIPDGPRAVTCRGGRRLSKMAAVLNNFLPGAIPLVNSGQEMLERQPMNLGLNPRPPGRFALPETDPYYGKLAYFDRVALHWTNPGVSAMLDLIEQAARIRRRFIGDLSQPRNYFQPRISGGAESIMAIGWRVEQGRRGLVLVANLDLHRHHQCAVSGLPRTGHPRRACQTLLSVLPRHDSPKFVSGKLRLSLDPGEALVLLL